MPYLPTEQRNTIPAEVTEWMPKDAGELNYVVTRMIDNHLKSKGIRYSHVNEMIGALECCKLELYRRIVGPYEDLKAEENGDAYTISPRPQSTY